MKRAVLLMRGAASAMVAIVAAIAVAGCAANRAGTSGADTGEEMKSAGQRVAHEQLIVDTHIDVPLRVKRSGENVAEATARGQFDYPRAREGGLDVAFMSIYTPAGVDQEGGATAWANELIDLVETLVRENPDKFALAHSTAQVRENFTRGLISLPLGMENGGPIAGDVNNLQHFYERGIRYITLAHSRSNHISDSSYDENRQWQGLSEFGRELIPLMNQTGVMVDISHVSDDAFYQVIELSAVPVIASHSSARHFTPGFERNMSDEMIRTLAGAGGVIQITAGSSFISGATRSYLDETNAAIQSHLEEEGLEPSSPEARAFMSEYRKAHPYPFADVALLLDHIDHVVALVGVDHVGIGSDFEGVGDTLPVGFKDARDYPNLAGGLLQRGYSESDIAKVLGGNLMRVWGEVEAYAAQH